MASTRGQKELKTNWPVEEGLIAETTKQTGREMALKPEIKSLIKGEKWGSL